MRRFKFKCWEDPKLINPERTINLKQDMEVTAYYEEVPMRKGLQSESPVVTVTVHPRPAENTVLTLESDKEECNSGDSITLMGSLHFESDNAPLELRSLDIYKNNVKINTVTTEPDGNFTFVDTAEDVEADTTFNYQVKFLGD